MDNQEAARYIRNKYVLSKLFHLILYSITARLGTIWHVSVGATQGFHMESGKGAEDHTIVALKKGGIKIEVYKHKQVTPAGLVSLKPALPSISTVLEVIPKLLFLFLCIAFLVQRSSYCISANEATASRVTKVVCSVVYSVPLAPLAGMLFVATIFREFRKLRLRRTLQKQKMQ